MTSEWKAVSLGDITTWTSGGTPSKSNPTYWDGDIPWISASSMKTHRIFDSDQRISRLGLENGSRIADANTILLLVRGSELHKRIPVGIAARPVAFNQDVKALKPKPDVLPSFLFYWLLGNESILLGKVEHTGIGAGKLDTDVLKRLRISLPPLSEQKRIAHILGTLDDKIELNRKMNATLEAMARALFKSWFVDFDPVRAKMEGRQPEGMDADTAALFPDELVESELGLVPRGWEVTSLGKVIEIFDSKRIPLSSMERAKRQGPYPYYGAASVMDSVDDYLFEGIYVLMGEDGSVINADGSPVLQYVWGKLWVNNHAHVLQGANGISTEHLLLHLKECNIASFVTGAVQAKLNQGNLNRIEFVLPSKPVAKVFGSLLSPLFEKIRGNSEESNQLVKTRDALLPKLLDGTALVDRRPISLPSRVTQ